jgi:hypothetical protein
LNSLGLCGGGGDEWGITRGTGVVNEQNILIKRMTDAQRLRDLIEKPLEDSIYTSDLLRGVSIWGVEGNRSDGQYRRCAKAGGGGGVSIGSVHYVREIPPNVPRLVPDPFYWHDRLDLGSPEAIGQFGLPLLLSLALDRLWFTTIVGMHNRFLRDMMVGTIPPSQYTAELYGGQVMENFAEQIVPAFSMMLAFVTNSVVVAQPPEEPMVCALSLDKIDNILAYLRYCNSQRDGEAFVPVKLSLETFIADWYEWGSFMVGNMLKCHDALLVCDYPTEVGDGGGGGGGPPIDVYANMNTFGWELHMGFLSWTLFTQSMGTIGQTLGHYVDKMKTHPTEIGAIDRLYQWVKTTSMWIPRLSLMFTVCGICSKHSYERELAHLLKVWVQHCNYPSADGTVCDKYLRVAYEIHRRVNVELHMFQANRVKPINGDNHLLRWLPIPIDQTFEMEARHVPVRSKGGIDEDTFVNCIVPKLIKGTFHGAQQYYFHH